MHIHSRYLCYVFSVCCNYTLVGHNTAGHVSELLLCAFIRLLNQEILLDCVLHFFSLWCASCLGLIVKLYNSILGSTFLHLFFLGQALLTWALVCFPVPGDYCYKIPYWHPSSSSSLDIGYRIMHPLYSSHGFILNLTVFLNEWIIMVKAYVIL